MCEATAAATVPDIFKPNEMDGKYSREDIRHNTKIFRSLLIADVKSIDSAIEMAKTIGCNGLDLVESYDGCPPAETIRVAMHAINELNPLNVKIPTLNRLFNFLVEWGVMDDSADCNTAGLLMVKYFFVFHAKWFKGGFDTIRIGEDNAIVRMMENNFVCEQKKILTSVLDYISIASDRYLNTPMRDERRGKFITPLKAAVIYRRHHVIYTLFQRYPRVNIDLIHPDHLVVESLFLTAGPEMLWSAILGDQIVSRHHFSVSETVRLNLIEQIPPELIGIINSYLARMPLATKLLVLNK